MQIVNLEIATKVFAGVIRFTVQTVLAGIKTAIGSVLGNGAIVAISKGFVDLGRHFVVLRQASLVQEFEGFRTNGVGSCGLTDGIWRGYSSYAFDRPGKTAIHNRDLDFSPHMLYAVALLPYLGSTFKPTQEFFFFNPARYVSYPETF